MENCVGHKILTMSLVEGLFNVDEGNIMGGVIGANQRIQTFLDKIVKTSNAVC